MKNNKILKILMWVFAIIPAIFTAVMYRSIPDTMPMHFGIDGTVDR